MQQNFHKPVFGKENKKKTGCNLCSQCSIFVSLFNKMALIESSWFHLGKDIAEKWSKFSGFFSSHFIYILYISRIGFCQEFLFNFLIHSKNHYHNQRG